MQETREPESNQQVFDLQFEYAWRWFSFHARQRVTMFNFFLLTSGILANAYGLLLREDLSSPAAGVAILGVIACAVSIGFDIRNHQLVKLGEDVLCTVEKTYLFPVSTQSSPGNSPRFGILYRESVMDILPILKHKILIRGLEGVAGLGFLGAVLYALLCS